VLALFEVVVTGNIVFLAAFLLQANPSAAALHEIISDLDLNDGADAAEAVDYDGYEDALTQAEDIGLPAAAPIAGFL
jgi:hypothetical protein